ncbi:MAG: hypothetical protein QOE14_2744 [Humisphaera sp.]|nr:hypothetical protein [Humisphaera sp.]
MLADEDLAVPGAGMFAHVRAYNNQVAVDGPNGFGWFVTAMPYAIDSGAAIAIVFDPNQPFWFDPAGPGSATFVARYARPGLSLVRNTAAQTLTFTRAPGGGRVEVTVFNDLDALVAPGQFVQHTDARGLVTTVAAQTLGRIDELQRSVPTSGSTTVVQSLKYTYFTAGAAVDKLMDVIYRTAPTTSGPWTNRKRVTFSYYSATDTHGSQNDLKNAVQQRPAATGSTWNDVAIRYYRYYKPGDAAGFAHGLKISIGPEGYRRLFNAGINPDTASDTVLRDYADHYFEYDPSTQAVTKEVAAVCASCPGGGTTSDDFVYTRNPRNPPDGYNIWSVRAQQTLPDSSTIVVYSNYAGQPMLRVHRAPPGDASARKWINFYRYNAESRLIWAAEPSAVTGYDDAFDDLLNFNTATSKYQYLRDADGLIGVTDYYVSTNPATGAAAGYVAAEKLRRGQLGSDVLLRSYTYTSHTDAASGQTIVLPKEQIVHPDAANPAIRITTSFTYDAWYAGNRIQRRTTTLPVVPASQNGAGVANTIVQEFSDDQLLVQRTDPRGVVTRYTYDALLAAITQEIRDYQASPPSDATNVNLVTDYTYDADGQLAQTLGPPHSAVVGGSATSVRAATWNVTVPAIRPFSGEWGLDEQRTGRGYATGTAPSYAYTLINPVAIERGGKDGRVYDRITSRRTTGSGALAAGDTFAQTDWQSWSSDQYDARGQLRSTRVYHSIPASGIGVPGTSYGQTDFAYDVLERQTRVVSPGGTITRVVWETPQREAATWIGTDDTGATDANPGGAGTAPNNMVKVRAQVYDNGADGGDGNLTQVTDYAAATDTRVTTYGYDWRGRRLSEDGEVDLYLQHTYDNLDRVIRTDQRNTIAAGNLVRRSETMYDDRGGVFRQIRYAVDPASGFVGNALTSDTWRDASGNIIKHIEAGAGKRFTKTRYNGMGWITATYTGYDATESGHAAAASLTNDTIVEQVIDDYDDAGNLAIETSYQRLNDATGTGALSTATQPKARVSFSASWYDGGDRQIATARYGAVSGFTRPGVPPARSDTVLVTSTQYNDAGRPWSVTNPRGFETRTDYDAAGRTTRVIEAYDAGSSGTDRNLTTETTYSLEDHVLTRTVRNALTGDQITTYTYGTTLADSRVARRDLLRTIAYPDSVNASDRIEITYNRLGEEATRKDQRGTLRTLEYDKLGRLIHDRVTTLGSATHGGVRRISRAYDVRGMLQSTASYDTPTGSGGTPLDETRYDYNGFTQLVREWQSHDAGVVSSSHRIEYGYATGASGSNHVRPEWLRFNNGRTLLYGYGTAGTVDDMLNRVNRISDGGRHLAWYNYLGLASVIRLTYPQPQILLDLWGGTSGQFDGLDRFGRVIDHRWRYIASAGADVDRFQYGYDRNSNRTWKRNVVVANRDEFYTYDALDRVGSMTRGTLNAGRTGITGTPARQQDWMLDPTGNWRRFTNHTNGALDLYQDRAHNRANEITALSSAPPWTVPAHDEAGNITRLPMGTFGGGGSFAAAFGLTPDDADDESARVFAAASFDSSSGPITPTGQLAIYDAWNRLTELHDEASGLMTAHYRHDGLGRQIVLFNAALGETRHFYFSNTWQVLEERIGTVTLPENQYVWGLRYVDDLICRDNYGTASGSDDDEHLFALQDANYNVTAVCDTTGVIRERYTYTPYGGRQIADASGTPRLASAYEWTIAHQGLWLDLLAGLLNNRRRAMHPGLGRFVQRDPLGYPEGLNAYLYEKDAPMNRLDPMGLQSRGRGGTGTGTKTADETECVCGPQVKNEVAQALAKVRAKFAGWSQAQRDIVCDAIAGVAAATQNDPTFGNSPMYLNAWDINELKGFAGPPAWLGGYSPPCATPAACASTVQISNQCFYVGSVNYSLLGVIAKGCGWSQARMKTIVYAYKGPRIIKPKAGNYESSQDWAAAAYKGWPGGVATPKGDRPNCATTCPQWYSGGAFTVYLAPYGTF